jgi:hypothetical protein
VVCLQNLPPKTPTTLVPGVRSRFDDFLATHINQTLSIHNTTNFLSWHRQFVWGYERALREECGYKGFQPVSFFGMLSFLCEFRDAVCRSIAAERTKGQKGVHG